MNRTATVLAAVVAALLLSAAPALAQDAQPFPGTPRAGGSAEPADGWEAGCIDEPAEEADGVWTCTLEVPPDPAEIELPDPSETVEPDEPEVVDDPEPVVIVEDNGDWGWSDARETFLQ